MEGNQEGMKEFDPNEFGECRNLGHKQTVSAASKSRLLHKRLRKYNLLSALVIKAKRKINHTPTQQTLDEQNDINSSTSSTFFSDRESDIQKRANDALDWKENIIISSVINFEHPFFTTNLANGCRILHETLRNLSDAEKYFIETIKNYIKEAKFQQELIDTISNQCKLRLEAESQSNSLSNCMWMQQMEAERSHSRSLQETINILVKQIRQLQIDKEGALGKFQETVFYLNKDHKGREYDNQVEDLLKHNKNLQNVLQKYALEIECMEDNMKKLATEKANLNELLNNAIVEIQKLNSKVQQAKVNYELDIVSRRSGIQENEQNVKKAAESVANEIGKIKEQLKLWHNTALISWTEFQLDNISVTQLLKVCETFINQMAKELICVHEKIHSKDKDIGNLMQDNLKLQDDLKKYIIDSRLGPESCDIEIKMLQEKMQRYEAIINSLLLEKHKFVEEKQNPCCGEPLSLHKLKDCEVNRFDKGDSEKAHLEGQLENLKKDNQILLEAKQNLEKRQNKELEKLHLENRSLKQHLENERKTVSTLQNERMKYLEEKNSIKVMFEYMKSELNRASLLEGAVFNVTKEANKLAIIAEHNKQMGEKLKNAVLEKENTIHQLMFNVDKLNHLQIQNTQDKFNLCNELTQVSNAKEWLNSALSVEMQKSRAMDNSKKEVLNLATAQIKQYFQLQKNEKAAIMDLLKDYKYIAEERNRLIGDNKKLHKKNEELRLKLNEITRKYDENCLYINDQRTKIEQFKHKHSENEKLVTKLEQQLSENGMSYNKKITESELIIKQLQKDNDDLNNTKKYLQNNIQKLHNDLNDARDKEKETSKALNDLIKDKSESENELISLRMKIESLNEEKMKLTQEVESLNNMCEKILSDYEKTIKCNIEKEDKLKKELDGYNVKINKYKVLSELLQNSNNKCAAEKQQLLENYNNLLQKVKQVEEQTSTINEQNLLIAALGNKKCEFERQLRELQYKYDQFKFKLRVVEDENNQLKNELERVNFEKDENATEFEKKLKEMHGAYECDVNTMRNEIDQLSFEMNDLLDKLENERAAYNNLARMHKDVSEKLLMSVKQLVEEKNRRQELLATLEPLNAKIAELQAQKIDEHCQTELNGNNNEKTLNGTTTPNVDVCEKDEIICHLNAQVGKLEAERTALQFEKSEITLRLHEIQGMLDTEKHVIEHLKNTQRLTLATILQLKENGKIDRVECNHLLLIMRNDFTHVVRTNDENAAQISDISTEEI